MYSIPHLDLPPLGHAAGTVQLPGSKSISNRLLLLAGLSEGTTTLVDLLDSDDTRVMLAALRTLGCAIVQDGRFTRITGFAGRPRVAAAELFLGNAGTAMRPLTAALAVLATQQGGAAYTLGGVKRMHERPIGDLVDALRGLGCTVDCLGTEGYPPLRVAGGTLDLAAPVKVRGDVSSQFISGLLFAAPLMESESSIEVLAPYESRSYVDMTVDAMQQFGVKVTSRARKNGSVMYRVAAPQRYTASDFAVEGDYSQAAFLAVLGCVIGGITVTGLNPDSQQGDKVSLDILKRCGGKFKPVEGGLHFDRSLLKATEIDLADCPDLGPILFTLGCFCSGETVIRNAGRLRLKESDRIEAMQTELRKMGARIEVDGDTVHIQGVALHAPNAPLSGHNDHRIVMALAVAAIASGLPALLCGAEAVDKSWPAFWSVLRGLGAKVELNTDKQEEFDIKA